LSDSKKFDLRKGLFYSTTVGLSLLTSTLFGTRLVSEWGSDFGVYFVGAMSISEDFGLYSGFFDHKGPTYYAFIHLLDFFIPFSRLGAVLVLSLTSVVWFSTIFVSGKILNLSNKHIFLLIVIGSAVLAGQPSNSSIALFLASLQILFLASLIKYRSSRRFVWMISSTFMISLAILTRVDSFLLLPIYLYFIGLKRKKLALLFVLSVILEVILFLYLFSLLLNFSFSEFWYQSVVFNFTTYPSASGVSDFNSHLWSLASLLKILFESGLVFLIIYIVFMYRVRLKNVKNFDFEFLVVYGLFLFFVVGSGKDYHSFIFFTLLVSSFFLLDVRVFRFRLLSLFVVVVLYLNSFYLSTLYDQSKCLFSYCTSPFDELAVQSGDNLFFINQGWPYLISGEHPDISFTSYYPLARNIKTASTKVLFDVRENSEKTIVLTKSDYVDLLQTTGSLLEGFLEGRAEPQEKIPGYLFFAPE